MNVLCVYCRMMSKGFLFSKLKISNNALAKFCFDLPRMLAAIAKVQKLFPIRLFSSKHKIQLKSGTKFDTFSSQFCGQL